MRTSLRELSRRGRGRAHLAPQGRWAALQWRLTTRFVRGRPIRGSSTGRRARLLTERLWVRVPPPELHSECSRGATVTRSSPGDTSSSAELLVAEQVDDGLGGGRWRHTERGRRRAACPMPRRLVARPLLRRASGSPRRGQTGPQASRCARKVGPLLCSESDMLVGRLC